jgi:hypothetical protein
VSSDDEEVRMEKLFKAMKGVVPDSMIQETKAWLSAEFDTEEKRQKQIEWLRLNGPNIRGRIAALPPDIRARVEEKRIEARKRMMEMTAKIKANMAKLEDEGPGKARE